MANPLRSRTRGVLTSYEPTVPSAGDGGPGSSPAERFDAFYAEAWAPLLLQTFAVCGDLALAREATRHAFVDAWHHWGRAEWRGPAEHVRSAAFTRGGWRRRGRVFHRAQHLDTADQETLDALAGLPTTRRTAVVLACLSRIELGDIARQVAETQERTVVLIDEGLDTVGAALGVGGDDVPARLRALEPLARAAARPTAKEIRTSGVRRRRGWVVGGVAAAVALTLGAGALVRADPQQVAAQGAPALGPTVTESLLLPTVGLAPLGKPANWSVEATGTNTGGTGINTFCQASRFADPQGLRAFVRTYRLDGIYQRRADQTIELSRSDRKARQAYRTVLGWFGGCRTSQLQLLSSYDVSGLGDEAEVIKMRAQSPTVDASSDPSAGASPASSTKAVASGALSSYAVGVVRTGDIVTWTAFTTEGAKNPSTDTLVSALTNALKRVCTSPAAGSCAASPTVRENAPPPSGEQPGMLSVTDLPPVPGVTQAWVGTAAATSRSNPSATTCDETDLVAGGADPAYVRTFLIPDADLPPRFGLSETLGELPGVPGAKALAAGVATRMASCEKRDPGATISQEASRPNGLGDSSWHLWRLESEVSDKLTIDYWMGIVRAGTNVAQVSFVPGDGKQDLSRAEFTALVVRARDRLFELDAAAASPSASASASGSPSASASTGG